LPRLTVKFGIFRSEKIGNHAPVLDSEARSAAPTDRNSRSVYRAIWTTAINDVSGRDKSLDKSCARIVHVRFLEQSTWIKIGIWFSCGRHHKSHYGFCSSVCPYVCLSRKQKGAV